MARYFPTPGVATHTNELPYIFDLPDAPIQQPFSPDQETLAASMRAAWANFAASGDPSSAAVPWPSFDAALALEFMGFAGPDVREGVASLRERRAPRF